mgnify:CR=1 FL=1
MLFRSPRIVEFIQREVAVLVKDKEIGARLLTLGFEPTGTTPAEFAKVIQAEITKCRTLLGTRAATLWQHVEPKLNGASPGAPGATYEPGRQPSP